MLHADDVIAGIDMMDFAGYTARKIGQEIHRGVTHVLGGEFEADLVAAIAGAETGGGLPRLRFEVPDRAGLPPLTRYASLHHGAEQRTVGYTEASRGCKHTCRHCPIVPLRRPAPGLQRRPLGHCDLVEDAECLTVTMRLPHRVPPPTGDRASAEVPR